GEAIAADILLEPIPGGSGRFTWNIGFPAEITAAQMSIYRFNETGALVYVDTEVLSIVGNRAVSTGDPMDLSAGRYLVVLTLYNAAGFFAELSEVMHIYTNMVSRFNDDIIMMRPRDPNAMFDLAHDPHFQSLGMGETGIFTGLPLEPSSGITTEVVAEQVIGGGTKNWLRVTAGDEWTGIDLLHSYFDFQVGDIVRVVGIAQTANNMRLQTPADTWHILTSTNVQAGATFVIERTINAGDITAIGGANPQSIRIRGDNGNATFTITELTAIRPGGLPPPVNVVVTAAGGATTVRAGEVLQFTASMQERPFQAFTWAVDPPVPGVSISGGMLMVEDTVSEDIQITVRATAFGTTVSGTAVVTVAASLPRLWQIWQNYFPLGNIICAGYRNTVANPAHANLLAQHFNILTAENDMKPTPLRPGASYPGTWNWGPAERLLDFAEANNIRFHGHALAWHAQSPAWLAPQGQREVAIARFEDHIETVMRRFGTRIESWDVLNEVIVPQGFNLSQVQAPGFDWRNALRDVTLDPETGHPQGETDWLRAIGPDYVEIAFLAARRVANEINPSVILYYNDYSMANPVKRHIVHRMVMDINHRHRDNPLVANVPGRNLIQAIGTQAHYQSDWGGVVQQVRETLVLFASLGVYVSVTELTFGYSWGYATQGHVPNPPPNWGIVQGVYYARLFNLFRNFATQHPGRLRRVTLWGPDDGTSWREGLSHLWDANLEPKPAFFAVANPTGFLTENAPQYLAEFPVGSFTLPTPNWPNGDNETEVTWQHLMLNGYLGNAGGDATLNVVGENLVLAGRTENWHGITVNVAQLRASFGAGDIDFVLAFDPPLNWVDGVSNHGAVLMGSGIDAEWNPGSGTTLTLPAGNNGGVDNQWGVTSGVRILVNRATGTVHPSITLLDILIGGTSILQN
ncbi:MAG: endo-1,4-beta-xylanase, partial [Treponema sp.]|nr:endo-1,4-beta-xylanase [Treponema sp.]